MVGHAGSTQVVCMLMWPGPYPRSRSRSRRIWTSVNCPSLHISRSPPPFARGAQNWWLIVIVCDPIYSFLEPGFGISFYESYHESSNFAKYRYFRKFKWPYFGTAWSYSYMVGYAGSPTGTVYVGVTLTRSKVKVKVTGLFNFRQLAKPCMLAAMSAAPLRGFLVKEFYYYRYLLLQYYYKWGGWLRSLVSSLSLYRLL